MAIQNKIDSDQIGSIVNVNATDHGDTSEVGSLKYVCDLLGSESKTITLEKGTYSVGTSFTIPSNVAIRMNNGAVLQIATGQILTINGPFEAGVYQVFDCVGAGSVSFGTGSVREIYSQWWKENINPGITDMTSAITAAISAAPISGMVILPAGKSLVSSTLSINKKLSLRGFGEDMAEREGYYPSSTLLKSDTLNATLINVTGFGASLKYFAIEGLTGNGGDGITVTANKVALLFLSVCSMGEVGVRLGSDVHLANSNSFSLYGIVTSNNGSHGIYLNDNTGGFPDVNAGVIASCASLNNGGDGIRNANAWMVTYLGNTLESNTGYGINFTSNSRHCTMLGGDSEESNGLGSVYNAGIGNTFIGPNSSTMVEEGTLTVNLNNWSSLLSGNLTVTNIATYHGGIHQLGNQVFLNRQFNTQPVTNDSDINLFKCVLPNALSALLAGTLYINYFHSSGGDGSRYVTKAYHIVANTGTSGCTPRITELTDYSAVGPAFTSNVTTATWNPLTKILTVINHNKMADAGGMMFSWSFIGYHVSATDFELF